jgi:magnesium chelatase family protein
MSLALVHSRAKSGVQAPVVRESRDRVRAAISCAQLEFPNRYITVNLAPADLKTHCQLVSGNQELFDKTMNALQVSARATYRILRVARTIADLAASLTIGTPHLGEAIQYRQLDRALTVPKRRT